MRRRRFPTLAVATFVAVAALGVACSGGDSDETQQQIATAGDLASKVEGFEAAAGVHVLDRTADIPDPPAGTVALRFSFRYPGDSLPGDGVLVHEASPEVNSLWAMESLPKGQAVPAGDAIADQVLFLEPGESRMVTVVFENPTTEDVGFIALPHQDSPGSLATKTWLTCFCLTFIYEAPAEGAWYRVIRVAVSPDTPAGSKIDAQWTIVTDPAVFPTS
jgi:hypothetical protein